MKLARLHALALTLVCTVATAQTISPRLVGTNFWFQIEGRKAEALAPYLAGGGLALVRIGGNGYNKKWPGDETVGRWAEYVRAQGAEPLIQVSALQTPAQVAETVRFFNKSAERRPVAWWSIGNEPDLDKWPATRVRDYVLELAAAMKAVDPTIRIYAPDLAGPHFEYLDRLVGGDLDITGAKLGDVFLVDGITWHRYAFWKPFTRDEALTRVEAAYHAPIRKLRALMARADALHGRVGEQALRWGLGEFNLHVVVKPASNPELYQSVEGVGVNSFFNGQFFAEVYGVCMAEEAAFATSWSIHESNGDRGTTDFGLFDGPVAALVPRSSYHHTALVGNNLKGAYLPVGYTMENLVAYAATHDGGAAVLIANKDAARGRTARLRFDGVARGSEPDALTVAAVSPGVAGGSLSPALRRVSLEVDLPPRTTRVLVFDAAGTLRKRATYSLEHARKNLPPTEEIFPAARVRSAARGPR